MPSKRDIHLRPAVPEPDAVAVAYSERFAKAYAYAQDHSYTDPHRYAVGYCNGWRDAKADAPHDEQR